MGNASDATKIALIKQLLAVPGNGGLGLPDLFKVADGLFDLALLLNPTPLGLGAWAAFQLYDATRKGDDAPCTDNKCRLAAAISLGRQHVQEAILPLTAALQTDPDRSVRFVAAAVIGSLLDATIPAGERTVAILALQQASLNDKDANVREKAKETYAASKHLLPPPPVVPPSQKLEEQVIAALGSASPAAREAAIITIQTQGLRGLLSLLVVRLDTDPSPAVRARAATVLGVMLRRGDWVLGIARASLQQATQDPDPAVQAAARAALAKTRWLVYPKWKFAVGGIAIAAVLAGGVWLWRKTPRALGAVDETLMRRVANMLTYGSTKQDVRERLRAEGYSDHDIFLAYKAAEMLLED